jgi:hypothetical protein
MKKRRSDGGPVSKTMSMALTALLVSLLSQGCVTKTAFTREKRAAMAYKRELARLRKRLNICESELITAAQPAGRAQPGEPKPAGGAQPGEPKPAGGAQPGSETEPAGTAQPGSETEPDSRPDVEEEP